MRNFLSIQDLGDLKAAVAEAISAKKNPYEHKNLGVDKSLALVFLNPSLRTRLSSQRAAQMLGLDTIVHNAGADGWNLAYESGKVMNTNESEHIRDAAAVFGEYFDILAVRCFPGLQDRHADYAEETLSKFVEYSGIPVVSLESATGHPLQALADMMTIQETSQKKKPKVVLSWAPHVKALPQSVPNSFVQASLAMDYDLVITHPPGFELNEELTGRASIVYDQREAFKDADYIYAKSWSSYEDYGKLLPVKDDWTINAEKMKLTNQARFMHCLPVRRNVVVTDEVIDSSNSIVYQQAQNRIFSCQYVLKNILQNLPQV